MTEAKAAVLAFAAATEPIARGGGCGGLAAGLIVGIAAVVVVVGVFARGREVLWRRGEGEKTPLALKDGI